MRQDVDGLTEQRIAKEKRRSKMRYWSRFLPLLIVLALLAAACAPAAAPTPTPTKPPAPAASPAAPAAATPTAAPKPTAAAATPAPKAAEPKPPVVLGSVLSLVGPAGSVGIGIKQGMDLALEEINAKGGIDGRKIEVIYEDDEGNPAKATSSTTKLIQKDKVVAILGAAVTATTVAAAQAANAEKVVIFSPTFTGDTLTAPGSGMAYVFRIGLPDRFTIGKLVQFGLKKYTKIGIFTDSGPAGQSITPIATKLLTDAGKPPVSAQTHDTRSPDMTPQLLNLQKAGAEAIITQAVPGDAPTILKGMKQISFNAQILGHLGFADPAIRNVALEAAQGVYGIDSLDAEKPDAKRLLDAFVKKYGGDPGSIYWLSVAHGYDAVYVMAEALKRANFDGSKLKDALESIKDFPAVAGNKDNKISFGPGQHDGNGQNAVLLVQVKGKDLVKVE